MKRLILLRHAKSAWDEPALADFDRPLAPRGRRAATPLARFLDPAERAIVGRAAYGPLLQLRDRGDLDDLQLERVLNQVLGTRNEPVDLAEIKRSINLVLFVSPDGESPGVVPPGGEDDLPRTH